MQSGSCLFELLTLTDFLRAMQNEKTNINLNIHLFEDDPNKLKTLVIVIFIL
jgi:hypothetical protein